jgi:iron(III) transport system permease protein
MPVLGAFAVILVVLIVVPMAWLVIYAFTDKAGTPTLANIVRLFTDAAFLDPLLTTLTIATTVAVVCCLIAAPLGWLVARTDMPLSGTVRTLIMASFVTPPFLGAIAWELLAAPNSGLLNQAYRSLTGAGADEHLFNIYSLGGLIFVISTCSCLSPMRWTASRANSKMPPQRSAGAPGLRRGGSRSRSPCRRFWPVC